MRKFLISCLFLTLPAMVSAQSAPTPGTAVDVVSARASMTGEWAGTLEYRDYTADRWFGIPVKTRVADQGDGATTIRASDFDDGPKVGNVRITSVELFDAATSSISVGTFRKGRAVEVMAYNVRLDPASRDATHWTMIEEAKGTDDERPATLRLTTVRDGDRIKTIKEVDFLDDDQQVWLTRNRTRLTRSGL